MIGLDTNVLVRYIMQDDPKQARKASLLIESLTQAAPGYVPVVVVLELFWVLTKSYELSKEQASQALEMLLRTKELVVDRAEQVAGALRLYKSSTADFSDCLIERIAASAGCERTMTFDAKAAKLAGMTLVV